MHTGVLFGRHRDGHRGILFLFCCVAEKLAKLVFIFDWRSLLSGAVADALGILHKKRYVTIRRKAEMVETMSRLSRVFCIRFVALSCDGDRDLVSQRS